MEVAMENTTKEKILEAIEGVFSGDGSGFIGGL